MKTFNYFNLKPLESLSSPDWLYPKPLVRPGIKAAIRTSHVVTIGLMLIPLLIGIAFFLSTTVSSDRRVSLINKANHLRQTLKVEINDELRNIVDGNILFSFGRQYELISSAQLQMDDLMRVAAEYGRPHEAAARYLGTLESHVDYLGAQIRASAPAMENEQVLEGIQSILTIVSDALHDFIIQQTNSVTQINERNRQRVFILGIVEAAVVVLAIGFSLLTQMFVTADVDAFIGSLIEANVQEHQTRQKFEMKALQAQIEPHFLYNTLDSIVWLAESGKYAEVITMTHALSRLFRSLLNKGSEWGRVYDAFEHMESYLTIQKIRCHDILDYSIEYDDAMAGKTMLKMLLQPLVENAVYHGIKNKRGLGMIKVRGWIENGLLCFSIDDDGKGIPEDELAVIKREIANEPREDEDEAGAVGEEDLGVDFRHSAFGLYNISRRLGLYYGGKASLDIQSVYTKGTTVILKLPVLPAEA
jgi:two-component system sensor histidine kinase YesM